MSQPISARPFAYNPGSPITGTIQVGNLAVGYPTTGYTGMEWWNGPDEELGYVIAQSVPDDSQPTPVPGVTGSVGFFRTDGFDDNEFIDIANTLLNSNYNDPYIASSALTYNGYWNSYSTPVLYLDAGNPSSYPGSGTTWTDLIGGKQFSLINNPTYSSSNGGRIQFNPSSGQYANCSTSLPSLTNWTVGVWHYYSGNNTGTSPNIVSEVFTGGYINYILGNGSDTSPDLQTGFWAPGWILTENGYTLTPNNWYYIVGTYDGNTLKLYVNNTLVESTSGLVYTPQSSNSGIFLMSRWDNQPNELWGGYLSTVGIYDKALSQSQITSLWNSTKSRFGL